MDKIRKLLAEAEAEAKKFADANPENAVAQALRARVLSALELVPHAAVETKPKP